MLGYHAEHSKTLRDFRTQLVRSVLERAAYEHRFGGLPS